MLTYQRRVSFDSITPEGALREQTIPRVPPQYNDGTSISYNTNGTKKRNMDLNFGYEPLGKQADIHEVFSSFDRIGNGNYIPEIKRTRKAPKLPPPPQHSILKNTEIPRTVPELPTKQQETRKTSLVGLTDEELIARDAQYRLGVDLDKLRFDGDAYLPTFMDTYQGKTRYDKVKKIDMSLADLKAKSKNLTNLNSYSVTYRHHQYYDYIKDQSQEDEVPDSLRNVMLYISGRKHTWVGIDWCLDNYLRDGDQLIIISQVQEDEDYKDDLKKDIARTSNNLRNYICDYLESINKANLKIAFTFDFISDTSMESLIKNATEFYHPQVFLISSLLSNLNITFEEGKKRKKLPIYLITLKIPSVIIPEQLIVNAGYQALELKIPNFGGITIEDHEDFNFEQKLNRISDDLDESLDHQPIITFRHNSTSTGVSRQDSAVQPQLYTPTQVTFNESSQRGSTSHATRFSVSSRRNSSHSAGGTYPMQKVKSMLEFDEPSSAPVKPSKSNDIQKQKTNEIMRSKSLDATTEKPKKSSIFGSFFSRKKK